MAVYRHFTPDDDQLDFHTFRFRHTVTVIGECLLGLEEWMVARSHRLCTDRWHIHVPGRNVVLSGIHPLDIRYVRCWCRWTQWWSVVGGLSLYSHPVTYLDRSECSWPSFASIICSESEIHYCSSANQLRILPCCVT